MKSASYILATLVLAFGLIASGCGSDTKSKKAKAPTDEDRTCEAGEVFSHSYDRCLSISNCTAGEAIIPGTDRCGPINTGGIFSPTAGGLTWYKGQLNLSNDDLFASFVESYGYTRNGQAFCVDNEDDVNFYAGFNWFGFPTVGVNANFGLWGQNCNTYDPYELWLGFSADNVASDGSTLAEIYIVTESTGAIIDLKLPHDARFSAVRRANQDQEFVIQGYLYKLAYPQDWAHWYIEGSNINPRSNGGVDIRIKWDGGVMATSSTRLHSF